MTKPDRFVAPLYAIWEQLDVRGRLRDEVNLVAKQFESRGFCRENMKLEVAPLPLQGVHSSGALKLTDPASGCYVILASTMTVRCDRMRRIESQGADVLIGWKLIRSFDLWLYQDTNKIERLALNYPDQENSAGAYWRDLPAAISAAIEEQQSTGIAEGRVESLEAASLQLVNYLEP